MNKKILSCFLTLAFSVSSIYSYEESLKSVGSYHAGNAADKHFKKINSYRKKRSYDKLGIWLSKNIVQDSDLYRFYQISENIKSKRLKKAITATMNAIKEGTSGFISNGELLQLSLFIETNIKGTNNKRYYFDSADTKLPRSIEVDPQNGNIIIYLEDKDSCGVGSGWLKKFNISLLYGVDYPKIITTGFFKVAKKNPYMRRISSREVKAMKKLNGKPGVVKPYSFLKHKNVAKNKDEIVFVEKLYRGGSIRNILDKKSISFTHSEKIKLASDFISGLRSIHNNGVIHGDLHSGNYLVDVYMKKDRRSVSGAITDFGKCRMPKNTLDDKYSKMRKHDIFRLGLAMYGLFHNEYIDHHIEPKVASREEIPVRRAELIEKSKLLTLPSEERFESLILNMINQDKEQIGNIDEIFEEIKSIERLSKSEIK